jgi:hypothetical protein
MTSGEDKLYINILALGAAHMFVIEKIFDLKLFSTVINFFDFIDFEI